MTESHDHDAQDAPDADQDGRVDPAPDSPPTAPDGDPATWGTEEGRRMLALLWDPPAPPARGPRQRLSVERVVAAGMAVALRDGVEGLSMRKVAAELGVGAMSLYTYVPGRDELFELMIDRAWADRTLPDPTLPWREQVEHHALQAWAMYQAHPWLVHSNLWRMPLGPNVLDAQEDLYRAVALADLTPVQTSQVSGLVESHVFGCARAAIVDTRTIATTGQSTDDYWDSRSSFWGTYFSTERFPTMTSLWEQGAFEQATDKTEQEMLFGLGLVLAGVERLRSGESR